MVEYNQSFTTTLGDEEPKIFSFLNDELRNLDKKSVASFGNEWHKFQQFSKEEIDRIGNDYFDLTDFISNRAIALDVGCGGGRWALFLQSKVSFIEAIDPSTSVFAAAHLLKDCKNVRVTQASVENIPFDDNSFDLVYSLGVLHHIPDTNDGIKQCFRKTKQGGWFLLYLYYNLDNRGFLFKNLFKISNVLRMIISSLPTALKNIVCEAIAFFVYWPLAKLSKLVSKISVSASDKIPLSYYRKTSFYVMRNDALDRFGTPLEKRFSKQEITQMLIESGFVNIKFSSREPFWHVIAQKP